MNIKKLNIYLPLVLFLSACAGKHTLPDIDYSESNTQRDFSIAYDQNGHFYPQMNQVKSLLPNGDFNWLNKYKYNPFSSESFSLTELKKDDITSYYYKESTDLKLTDDFSKTLNTALVGLDKLYIFIHGFNVNYEDAFTNIETLKGIIETKDGVSISVFWDGLHDGYKFNIYPNRWNKAMLYSNYAGQFGLRELLLKLDSPTEVVFITHSRGAAVAFSTIFDPLYTKGLEQPQTKVLPSLSGEQISKVKMLLLAPAIGDGHLSAKAIKNYTAHFPVSIYTSSNSEDFANCKSFIGGAYNGDTRLGCGEEYYYITSTERRLNKLSSIEMKSNIFNENRWSFWQTCSHAVSTYLKSKSTQVMMCKHNFAKDTWCKKLNL